MMFSSRCRLSAADKATSKECVCVCVCVIRWDRNLVACWVIPSAIKTVSFTPWIKTLRCNLVWLCIHSLNSDLKKEKCRLSSSLLHFPSWELQSFLTYILITRYLSRLVNLINIWGMTGRCHRKNRWQYVWLLLGSLSVERLGKQRDASLLFKLVVPKPATKLHCNQRLSTCLRANLWLSSAAVCEGYNSLPGKWLLVLGMP